MGVRRFVTGAIVMALVIGAVGLDASVAGAAKPVITATGDVTCTGTGTVKTGTRTTGAVFEAAFKMRVSLACTGTTGDPRVKVKRAKLKMDWSHQGACSFASTEGGIRTRIDWKAVGGFINPSVVSTSNSSVSSSGWSAPATDPPGSVGVGGSYQSVGSAHITISSGIGAVALSMCGNPRIRTRSAPATVTLSL
jgi:hypothetical protein